MKVETSETDTAFEVLNTTERKGYLPEQEHIAFVLTPLGIVVRTRCASCNGSGNVIMDKLTFKRFAQWAADAAKDL